MITLILAVGLTLDEIQIQICIVDIYMPFAFPSVDMDDGIPW